VLCILQGDTDEELATLEAESNIPMEQLLASLPKEMLEHSASSDVEIESAASPSASEVCMSAVSWWGGRSH